MKKFIALALALVMLCCCAAGCSSGSKEDTVMTVNGTAVGFDEYMAGLNQAVSELEDLYQSYSGTSVDWNGKFMFDDSLTNIEWCLKRAAQQVARYRVVEAKADELGLTLTEDQQSAIDEQIESIKEQYVTSDDDSDTQLKAFFATYGYTEDSYKERCRLNYLYTNLFTELYGDQGSKLSDEKVQAYAEENDYITSAHILFLTTETVTADDGTTSSQAISDEAKAEKKAKAEELCAELKAISDDSERWARFKELMNEYSEDQGLEQFPEGYCFTTGSMVDEYDDASRALEEYQVSDVVESKFGYHIIMRLPVKGTDLVSYSNGYQQSVVPLTYLAAPVEFDSDVADWASSATIKYTKLYDSIDFSQFISSDGFAFQSYADYSAAQSDSKKS